MRTPGRACAAAGETPPACRAECAGATGDGATGAGPAGGADPAAPQNVQAPAVRFR